MRAKPIVPGLMYQVTGQGIDEMVFASNPVDALVIGLVMLDQRGGL